VKAVQSAMDAIKVRILMLVVSGCSLV